MLDAEDAIATAAVDGKKAENHGHRPGLSARLQPQRPRPAAPSPGSISAGSARANAADAADLIVCRVPRRCGPTSTGCARRLGDGDPPAAFALWRQGDRLAAATRCWASPSTTPQGWRAAGHDAGSGGARLRNGAGGRALRNVSGHLVLPGSPAACRAADSFRRDRRRRSARPAVRLADGRADSAVSTDDRIFATYCRGVFDHPQALTALLAWARPARGGGGGRFYAARREADLERLADSVEAALDWEKLAPCLPDWANLPARCAV